MSNEQEELSQRICKSARDLAAAFDPSKFPGKHLLEPLRFSNHPWFKSTSKYLTFETTHERVSAHIELLEEWRERHAIPTE